jgi:transposase-like protein
MALTMRFKFKANAEKRHSSVTKYRRINSRRTVFPSEAALKKALFLATQNITKKQTVKIKTWEHVFCELSIIFDGRL